MPTRVLSLAGLPFLLHVTERERAREREREREYEKEKESEKVCVRERVRRSLKQVRTHAC